MGAWKVGEEVPHVYAVMTNSNAMRRFDAIFCGVCDAFHQVWGKGGKPVFVELDMVAAQNDDDGDGGGGGSGGDGVC